MYGLLFMVSATSHVQNPVGTILVPRNVAEELAAQSSVKTSPVVTEQGQTTTTSTINPAQAVFEARQNLANAVTQPINEATDGINTAKEASTVGVAQADNSAELLAEQLKKMGTAIAAGLVDDQDRRFIALVAKVLNSIECDAEGVKVDKLTDVKKVIGSIQDIYVTAKTSGLEATMTEDVIRNQLKSLGLSKEQKATMQDYFKKILGQSNASADSVNLDALKNLALSKEGMLAVGTALYVFSGLVSQIPYIGNLLATPIKLVQGLLGTAKDIIPMILLMQQKEAAPAKQIQPSTKVSSADSKPAPASVAAA